MSTATTVIIRLHPEAPSKPASGKPCNGCGVCCALETCPLARVRFRQTRGPCPALTWSDNDKRYLCGLLSDPVRFWSAMPNWAQPFLHTLSRRWIASGIGCDCDAEIDKN